MQRSAELCSTYAFALGERWLGRKAATPSQREFLERVVPLCSGSSFYGSNGGDQTTAACGSFAAKISSERRWVPPEHQVSDQQMATIVQRWLGADCRASRGESQESCIQFNAYAEAYLNGRGQIDDERMRAEEDVRVRERARQAERERAEDRRQQAEFAESERVMRQTVIDTFTGTPIGASGRAAPPAAPSSPAAQTPPASNPCRGHRCADGTCPCDDGFCPPPCPPGTICAAPATLDGSCTGHSTRH